MTHEQETEQMLVTDPECDFCGEDLLMIEDNYIECKDCGGYFCSNDCHADHKRDGVVPYCGGKDSQ